jgi:hypothetical protein
MNENGKPEISGNDIADEIEAAYKPVPVEVAARISEQFDKSQVIVVAWDAVFGKLHTTTFGVTAFDKESAAAAGEICCKALDGNLSEKKVFEDFHNDYDPAFLKEATDLLKTISRRQDSSPTTLQRIERLLKAMGHGIRQG